MEPTASTSRLAKAEPTTPDSTEKKKKNSRVKTPSTRRPSAASTPKATPTRKRPAAKQLKEQPESGEAPEGKDSPSVKDYLLQLMKEGKIPIEETPRKQRKTTAEIVDEVLLENQAMEVAREETVEQPAMMEEASSSSQEQLVEEEEEEEVPLQIKQETNAVNMMIMAKGEMNVRKTPIPRKKPGYRRVTKGPNKDPVPNYLIDNPPIWAPNPVDYLPDDASGDWTSTELYALYVLMKTYGTSDTALEYISGCGLERESTEIREFVTDLRNLKDHDRLLRMNAFFKYHAQIADAAGNEITLARRLPVTENFRETHSKWATAALTISGQYRSFNHRHVRDCLSSCLDKIPETRYADVKATDSWSARRRDQRMDLDYGNIRKFLQQTLSIGAKTAPELNALESAVVLSILGDIEKEARQTFDVKQTAAVRGLLRKIKRGDLREFDHEFPCNELSSTQLYVDPFRTREWNLPPGGKPVSLEDVDAGRVCTHMQGGDGGEHHHQQQEQEQHNELLVEYPSEEENGIYNNMEVETKVPIHMMLEHEANGDIAGPSSPPHTKPHVI